jgi:pimeloyl-ACP methyl ester carboxylesterase
VASFPGDPQIPLRHKAERTENIVRWTELDRGGHFAALEEPDLLVEDVRAFFRQLREKG